jgi:hypothetical protein
VSDANCKRKTQLGLKFAQQSRTELSVIWVRADNWENFVRDPAKIFQQNTSTANLIIEETREQLEERPEE